MSDDWPEPIRGMRMVRIPPDDEGCADPDCERYSGTATTVGPGCRFPPPIEQASRLHDALARVTRRPPLVDLDEFYRRSACVPLDLEPIRHVVVTPRLTAVRAWWKRRRSLARR